jgi:hypothetical protein
MLNYCHTGFPFTIFNAFRPSDHEVGPMRFCQRFDLVRVSVEARSDFCNGCINQGLTSKRVHIDLSEQVSN